MARVVSPGPQRLVSHFLIGSQESISKSTSLEHPLAMADRRRVSGRDSPPESKRETIHRDWLGQWLPHVTCHMPWPAQAVPTNPVPVPYRVGYPHPAHVEGLGAISARPTRKVPLKA